MPPCASSKRPVRRSVAPVKAPRSWPKSSLSTRPLGSAAQLTLMSGRLLRGLREWIARAISSLPVPVSPRMRTEESGRRDQVDLLEGVRERAALADDLLEVVDGLDLLLQVEVLAVQLAQLLLGALALVDVAQDQREERPARHLDCEIVASTGNSRPSASRARRPCGA